MRFADRIDAGTRLADHLVDMDLGGRPVVLALPRGGVPVGEQVARALDAPLDVVGVRKIGAPGQQELGVGAIGEGGAVYLDEQMLRRLRLSAEDLRDTIAAEQAELARRVRRYRGDRPLPDLDGACAVVVDDGLATGVTARAALRAVRAHGATRVVLAIPVCAPGGRVALVDEADEIVCVAAPEPFVAVGQWYARFEQVSDEEVLAALERSRDARTGGARHR